MSTEEQAIKNERRRTRDAQRRQNMTDQERMMHNERRRNEYRANQGNMPTEEQQAKNERRRIRYAQRRQDMTEQEQMLHNERRHNEDIANQQIPRNDSQQVVLNESHQEVMREDHGNMPTEEQQAIKNERRRIRDAQRRQNMTEQEQMLHNERRRNEYRANQQILRNDGQQVILNESHQDVMREDQRNMLSEEKQAMEMERRRIHDANRRQTMTDQEKNLRNERRRNQYKARHHQGETRGPHSSSTSNAPTNLFEHVIHEHVQAEVERLIGRVKTVAINTSKGYMELGPQHRAPLHTSFEDMLEFDGLINELENDPDNRQEDLHEALQPTHGNSNRRRRGTHVPNRGFHNCAREFIDLHSLPPLQLSGIRPCNHCGAKLFPHETSDFCCLNGKVTLPDLPVPPELMELYTEQSEDATHFRQHIRSYNHVFSFTSIGVHIDNNLANCKKGVYTYRAQGTMYHKIGSLIPEPSNRPRFLQMYIYDTEHELENRLKEQVELPFGGKLLVLGGDFRQVLPVIQNGDRAQTINACLISSNFWKYVNVIQLKENMRARLDPHFSEFLLRIGDGAEKYVIDDMVKLPDDILLHWDDEQSVRRLIDDIFPKLEENAFDSVYMSQRALITPRNDDVENLNQKVVEIFPGSEVVYHSFDSVVNDTNHLWTEDFLNSIAPGGLPPHKLILKIGVPIMLLRNLDPKNGLCNGTRLLCRRLLKNSIDAEIFSGSCSGTRVLIPRIPLEPSNDTKLPFKFVRKQFPVRASFALTINKSQGQTIPNVGIYLRDHVFSHGQLYVALSRGISRNTTKVLVSHGFLPEFAGTFTRNVVFQEILRLCAPSSEDSLRGAEPEITGQYANNARNKGKQKIQEPVFTVEGSTSCLTSSHENSSRGSSSTMIDDLALTSHNL